MQTLSQQGASLYVKVFCSDIRDHVSDRQSLEKTFFEQKSNLKRLNNSVPKCTKRSSLKEHVNLLKAFHTFSHSELENY